MSKLKATRKVSKQSYRSKSLSPQPASLIMNKNQRRCNYGHSNRRIDTNASKSLLVCADCNLKVLKSGVVYGCNRCKFYLCSACLSKQSCLNGHILHRKHVNKNTECNKCSFKSKKKRLQMYGCNICKYNMCLGCYSSEICMGGHGLKYLKIKKETHKRNFSCFKCKRVYKIGNYLFLCGICKYSLCPNCYQPSISIKQKIHKHQSIVNKLKEKKMASDEDDDHHDEEEKKMVLTDESMAKHDSGQYSYHSYSHSNSFSNQNNILKNKKTKKKKNKHSPKNNHSSTNINNNNNNNVHNMTYAMDIDEVSIMSSSVDLCGLESIAPSEMTRIPSILTECCICMEVDKNVAFLPCGHYISCEKCALLLKKEPGTCAICSTKIQSVIKIYE